jgi:nitrate/nitrite transport system ATP-binding protein
MGMISLKNVSKSYGGRSVLRDVSLSVEAGDFVTIIGYSGTGKTTLMSLLAGLTAPDSGQVVMNGEMVTSPGPERGLVFQNYSLLPWLTVSGNIHLAVDALHPDWSKSQRAEHVTRYIKLVKLDQATDKYPAELSGGMRHRVSVALTLAMEPKVLLLDEPLSALDALTRAQLQDEISDIWQENRTTVIWVTNDPDEALLMADRVIPLMPGDGSGSSLGAAMEIEVLRPRDRRTIGQNEQFQALRRTLITTLIEAKQQGPTLFRDVNLPDILPEDLMTIDTVRSLNRRGPRRRSDHVKRGVEVLS